jgi:hypothetical protein
VPTHPHQAPHRNVYAHVFGHRGLAHAAPPNRAATANHQLCFSSASVPLCDTSRTQAALTQPHRIASQSISAKLRHLDRHRDETARGVCRRKVIRRGASGMRYDPTRRGAMRLCMGVGGTTLFSNRERRTPLWSYAMSRLPSRTPDSNHRRLTPFAIVG